MCMSVMSCARITGRRPLHQASGDISSDDDVQFVPSPKKLTCKKYRRRKIPILSPSETLADSNGRNSASDVSTKIDVSPHLITVTDESGDEYVDCVSYIPPKPLRSNRQSGDHPHVHTITSTSSEEDPSTVEKATTTKKQPSKSSCYPEEAKASNSKQSPSASSSHSKENDENNESEFMRTFKCLRDRFKESEEEDLIVLTKVHPDVVISYQDIKQVVQNIVSNVALNKRQTVESLTSNQVANRMRNLYHIDFTDRLDDISRCLQLAKLQYNKPETETEEIQPGLKSRDLATLEPGEWLNDVIINKYFELLARSTPSACTLSSFFYEELRRKGNPSLPNKWHEKTYLIIPVCISSHWSLLCAVITRRTVDIYNSMTPSQKEIECATIVLSYLNVKFNEETKQTADWSLMLSKNLPQQGNAYDCGVYICMYARLILFNLSTQFHPSQVTSFRSWIRKELIKDELDK